MQSLRYSQHKILSERDFTFDPVDYSKFKHGCGIRAAWFGTELALGFIKSELFSALILLNKPIVVLCSPYGHVQSAAAVIQRHFSRVLNMHLIQIGREPASEYKTIRDKFYIEDYSTMDASHRRSLIFGDKFHIVKGYLENKILIHIDDVRITGAHEEVIEKVILENKLRENGSVPVFLYYAELEDQKVDPNIEHYINTVSVSDPYDIMNLYTIDPSTYQFNTRVIKLILSQTVGQFRRFIAIAPFDFKSELMHLAIGEGYYSVERYKPNMHFLISHMNVLEQIQNPLSHVNRNYFGEHF